MQIEADENLWLVSGQEFDDATRARRIFLDSRFGGSPDRADKRLVNVMLRHAVVAHGTHRVMAGVDPSGDPGGFVQEIGKKPERIFAAAGRGRAYQRRNI
jgi:hypothetical protein